MSTGTDVSAATSCATEHGAVLRLRGLPFSSGEPALRLLFESFPLATVVICRRNGRNTGEAYVQLRDKSQDSKEVIALLNGQYIGSRYVELFEATMADMETARTMSIDRTKGHVIRMRGLPYNASSQDVIDFFSGVEISRGAEDVVVMHAHSGKPTGEALVQLKDEASLLQAMQRHKEPMGSRYIELFRSTKATFDQAVAHSNRALLSYSQPLGVPLGYQQVHLGPLGSWMMPLVYQQGAAPRIGVQLPMAGVAAQPRPAAMQEPLPVAPRPHVPGVPLPAVTAGMLSASRPLVPSVQEALQLLSGMGLGMDHLAILAESAVHPEAAAHAASLSPLHGTLRQHTELLQPQGIRPVLDAAGVSVSPGYSMRPMMASSQGEQPAMVSQPHVLQQGYVMYQQPDITHGLYHGFPFPVPGGSISSANTAAYQQALLGYMQVKGMN